MQKALLVGMASLTKHTIRKHLVLKMAFLLLRVLALTVLATNSYARNMRNTRKALKKKSNAVSFKIGDGVS